MSVRWDESGFGWETEAKEKKKGGGYVGRKPPIPEECDWVPRDLPRLDAAKELIIDIETYDPELREKGPGVRRGGYIVGIAVATEDDSWYFPMHHKEEYDPSGFNMDRGMVLRWAKRELVREKIPKIGTNLMYDLDYLWEADIKVPGPYYDVQVAEPLIDENAFQYNLNSLANKYLGEGKRSEALYEWLALAYGGPATAKDQGGNLYRAPPQMLGHYALGDVEQPREILRKQRLIMDQKDEDLSGIFDLETRLIPMLLAMRRRGVLVDVDGAVTLDARLVDKAAELRERLTQEGIDPNSGDTIAAWCDAQGLGYKKTAQGNPSFVASWLENHGNEIIRSIREVRRLEKHAGTFVHGTILNNQIKGRVHCQFHQLRGDEYGAVSGRLSSSHPNLQNIPVRDEELGPLIRGLFLPDEGEDWYSDDWSQIEFRLLVNYGKGTSAIKTRRQFSEDPTTDFHHFVAELTGIERRPAKNINFGLVYGMGEPAMAANLGRALEEVRPMFRTYHKRLPFIRDLYEECDHLAMRRGWIRTILGRKRRWERWQVNDRKQAKKDGAFSEEEAEDKYGEEPHIHRAFTYKALNALLQGGAADIMKKAMVEIWETGICDTLGAPLLTVHDELNWSVPRTLQAAQAHNEATRIMESCVALRLPLLVDSGSGANWAEAK